ncbi:heparinase II/III domain-containing protein [Flavitalea sp.]|nr:heparinase II/III family protein [Flavitalea sp.]
MKLRCTLPVLVLAFFCHLGVVIGQTDYIGADFKLPQHPRILLAKDEESQIRKTIESDKTWQTLQGAIINECRRLINEPPVERIQIGRRLLDKSREALRRIFMLSYGYRMTKDPAILKRAEQELLAISGFSDWNPSHFLDVAEMTMAAAIGYDWLYSDLSDQSKTIIKEAIIKKGIEPSLDSKNNSFLRAEHNWNQVCNAGMTYGAMAIYEDNPELARKIINRALETIVISMADYGPDGAYPEGYGYWGYGTSFNVMFVSAIEKLFGKDFGLTAKPGFLKTAGFLENMTGPSGKPFNFSDAGNEGGFQPAMFWFASKLKDPSLLWVERSRLQSTPAAQLVRDRLLPGALLWSSGVAINNIKPPKETMWVGKGKNPVALMRTSWTDSNAIYVGLKGGSVSVNHAHMDIGSFVMEATGVRWAMDFGMQNYESLESKGIQLFGRTQDAQRWTVFRYTNLVHNTLAIDSQHQLVKGYAPIVSSGTSSENMNAVTDISAVYEGMVAKSLRGVAIVDKSYVVVRDEIKTNDRSTKVRWTMLTPADVKMISANSAELTKDGKKLILQVNTTGKVTMKTWSTDPPNSYDAPNPGTILVGFEVILPPNSENVLEVTLAPQKANRTPIKKSAALVSWK